MSEAFLHELLQACNIEKIEGERCGICLEEFDTLSRETGTIEVATRLPCNHIVGSACIATWLKDNNTCPICRRVFFEAQPRPYLEHGIMAGQGIHDEDEPRHIRHINEIYCAQLGLLDMEVSMISGYLIQKLIESRLLGEGHREECIIAVSIYMATHLTGIPKSPRQLANVTDVEADHIRVIYDVIYPERERLADEHFLSLMEEVLGETGPPIWPAPGHLVTDEEIEHHQSVQMLRERCEQACNELGLVAAGAEITHRVAARLYMAGIMASLSPMELTAASMLMASDMTCSSISTRRVAEAIHMSESRVRHAYQTAYDFRHTLDGGSWLETLGGASIESVLGRLTIR